MVLGTVPCKKSSLGPDDQERLMTPLNQKLTEHPAIGEIQFSNNIFPTLYQAVDARTLDVAISSHSPIDGLTWYVSF